jgi:hypothetical protein
MNVILFVIWLVGATALLATAGVVGYFVFQALKYRNIRKIDPLAGEIFRQSTEENFREFQKGRLMKSRLWWLAWLLYLT